MFESEEILNNIMQAGAVGFLLKNIEKDELETAIKTVINGQIYISKELLSYLPSNFIALSLN
jgi:DNA-binding NarL/FixJ family response regulator